MSDLKPCGCGDTPTSQRNLNDWCIHCLGCGVFIYAENQEKSERLWNDMQSASELRERIAELEKNCEMEYKGRLDAEALVMSHEGTLARLEARLSDPRYLYDVETPCPVCRGRGRRVYGSTSTWMGGIGGQAMTVDVCDRCWGSGDSTRTGANLRLITNRIKELEAQVKAMRCCGNCLKSDNDKCCFEDVTCYNYSHWQPRSAIKEG